MESKIIWKIKQVLSTMEMLGSLHNAIRQAGGYDAAFSSKELRTMTVAELFARLAPNGIRFYYKNPTDDIEKGYNPLQYIDEVKELYKNEYDDSHTHIAKIQEAIDSVEEIVSQIGHEGYKTNYDWSSDPMGLKQQESKIFDMINNLLGQTEYERQEKKNQETGKESAKKDQAS